jgi:predicted RNase H-like HicB family nuclease
MRFQGHVRKDGQQWLAEVPLFDAVTQGRTRSQALDMLADWFETMVARSNFAVVVHQTSGDAFEVDGSDSRAMISLLLRRQRHKSGLSLAQVAARLGARSRNAYARYERGSAVPTVEKLEELLKAVAPKREIVVRESEGV